MNATNEQVAQYNMEAMWSGNELGLKMVYGHCETLLVCDTYQFKDYSKYDCNMFSEPHKKNGARYAVSARFAKRFQAWQKTYTNGIVKFTLEIKKNILNFYNL